MNITDILNLKTPDKYDPCYCGSGKKYKWCCYGKPKPDEEILVMTFGDVFDKSHWKYDSNSSVLDDDVNEILYIPYYRNLPNEGLLKVEEVLKKYPIRQGMCNHNSTLFVMNIEGVERCRGWVSQNIFEMSKRLTNLGSYGNTHLTLLKPYLDKIKEGKKRGLEWIKTTNQNGEEQYINVKSGDRFIYHSWNRYKGIYFDITLELHKQKIHQERPYKKYPFYKYILKEVETLDDMIMKSSVSKSKFISNIDLMSKEMSKWGIYSVGETSLDLRPHKYIS